MKKFLLIIIALSSFPTMAQIRMEKLVIESKTAYTLYNSDIIVADTLIMKDSSSINLNGLKSENYIRAHVAIIGNNCMINGRGRNGTSGQNGVSGNTPIGPCLNGGAGKNGARGLDGSKGINLFLYIDSVKIVGKLKIDLSGGNGADGGDGGNGGGGSPGTNQCFGGDGGNGGNGGWGGDGGTGGTLTLSGKAVPTLRAMLNKSFMIYSKGGTFGYGGISGFGGAPGLGPQGKKGKSGLRGIDGYNGRPADNGGLVFEK